MQWTREAPGSDCPRWTPEGRGRSALRPRRGGGEGGRDGAGWRKLCVENGAPTRRRSLCAGPGREGGTANLPPGSLAAVTPAPRLRKKCRAVSPAPAAPTTAPATKPLRILREPLRREAKLSAAITPVLWPQRTRTHALKPESQLHSRGRGTHAQPEGVATHPASPTPGAQVHARS
jgi:hypothetical protein